MKTLRYVFAYVLFVIYALAGLLITWNMRSNVLEVSSLLNLHPQVIYILYTWGAYVVFVPYVFFIGLLEPYLNKAAKTDRLMHSATRIFLILGGAGLASLLITLICARLNP